VSNTDSYSRKYWTTKIAKFQFYFTALEGKLNYGGFWYTVALTAGTKVETLLFGLRAVKKKSALCYIAPIQ
jgi:hypothetical protein